MASPHANTWSLGGSFWRLWTSSSLSNLADGLFKVALPLVALRLTDSPLLIANVTTALTVPWLLFALPVGAMIDRLDRRRVMLWANATRAGVLVLLAAASTVWGLGSIWVIYVAALGAGLAEVFYDTSAQSILPQIVRREQLTRANGRLFAGELTANEFVGPPLGGLLVAVGAAVAFTASAGLWLVAAGVLLLVRGAFQAERHESTTLRVDMVDGLKLLWRNGVLRSLSILTAAFNFASGATMAILVVYAVGATAPIGLTEAQYGLLLAATAAGSLAGTFMTDPVQRRLGSSRTLAVGLAAASLFVGVPALTSAPGVIAAAFFVGGAGVVLVNVVAVSLRQRITPDAKLGRVTGAHRLLAWGTRPLGAATAGVIAQALGVRAVFAVMGGLVLTTFLLVSSLSESAIASAEGEGGRR